MATAQAKKMAEFERPRRRATVPQSELSILATISCACPSCSHWVNATKLTLKAGALTLLQCEICNEAIAGIDCEASSSKALEGLSESDLDCGDVEAQDETFNEGDLTPTSPSFPRASGFDPRSKLEKESSQESASESTDPLSHHESTVAQAHEESDARHSSPNGHQNGNAGLPHSSSDPQATRTQSTKPQTSDPVSTGTQGSEPLPSSEIPPQDHLPSLSRDVDASHTGPQHTQPSDCHGAAPVQQAKLREKLRSWRDRAVRAINEKARVKTHNWSVRLSVEQHSRLPYRSDGSLPSQPLSPPGLRMASAGSSDPITQDDYRYRNRAYSPSSHHTISGLRRFFFSSLQSPRVVRVTCDCPSDPDRKQAGQSVYSWPSTAPTGVRTPHVTTDTQSSDGSFGGSVSVIPMDRLLVGVGGVHDYHQSRTRHPPANAHPHA